MKKTIYSTLILLLLLTCIIVPTTAQESNPTYVVAQLAKPNDISEIDFSKFLEPRFEAGLFSTITMPLIFSIMTIYPVCLWP